MTRTRLPLALAAATASALLLAACSTPTPSDDDTVEAAVGGDIPTLRAEAPLPEPEDTPAPTPEPGDIPEGYDLVFDDTGVLSVVLPEAWSDVDGRPFSTTDGREWASIIATPDAEAYPTDWTVAGLEFGGTLMEAEVPEDVAVQFLKDLSAPLDEACEPIYTARPYDDNLYAGWFSNWNDCGDEGTFGMVVVAQDPEFHHLVFLRGKFVTEEERGEAFELIFTTFQSTQGLDKAAGEDRTFVPEG
jgi:serine protease Do